MLTLHHTPTSKDEGGGMKDESGNDKGQLHPSSFRLHPFTQTTCLISATIFTRSLWFLITCLMSL